ncbi:MAG: hypothetical protein HS109_13415 [Burkholderiales bacterium]|nr:hypothetical protein [Burkholderiales bacterium]
MNLDRMAALEARVARLIRDPATDRLEAEARALSGSLAGSGPALALLGEIARRRGDAAAPELLSRAVERSPGLVAAWHALALARVRGGDREGARSAWQAVLERAPADPVARYQIALTFQEERDHRAAASWYEAHLASHPGDARALRNLGLSRLAAGDATGAVSALDEAMRVDPASTAGWIALGRARVLAGDPDGAIAAWSRARALDPALVEPLERSAAVLATRAALPSAIALLGDAIALDPDKASLRFALAAHRSSLGEHREALAELRRAVALAPSDASGASALLFEAQYDDAPASRDATAAAHRDWAARFADPLPPVARTRRATRDDRLHVGYLSPRFGAGPLASLFLPILERHDRSRVHVTLYSAHAHEGAVASRLRERADRWRDLPPDDDAAARLIAADGLDLLVDLAGHAPGHRLGVLARRPAAIQVTWLDYADTTGMRAIDFLVSDAIQMPPEEWASCRERLVLLPCRFAYLPFGPPVPPETGPERGIRYGSFNRHAKLGHATLDAWRSILEAVPDARLALRAAAYAQPETVAWIRDRWAARGLPLDRIDFLTWLPLTEALAAYATVDVALDPFPFNGGVTTCDALVHGVPLVALRGDRPIARQSASLLAAAGHPEWIAATPDEYVRRAIRFARTPGLAASRAQRAAAVAASPLCDVEAFARRLERAFEAMVEAGPRGDRVPAPPIEIA